MTTNANLRVKVQQRLGRPTTDAVLTSTILTALVNEALDYLSVEADWEWLEKSETITTVNGTQSYSVAADCRRTVSLLNPEGFPIPRKPIHEVRMMGTASGTPRMFSPYKNALIVRPIPSGAEAFTHLYIGGETDLSADGDTPLLPAVWDPTLIAKACELAAMREGNSTEAAAYKASYDQWIEKMKAIAPRLSPDTGGGVVEPAS